MAKIKTYPIDSMFNPLDKWIGSDADNASATKNFTVEGLGNYFNIADIIHSQATKYKYQNKADGDVRQNGTISFSTQRDTVLFSDVTEFIISNFNLKGQNMRMFYTSPFTGNYVLITKSDNMSSNWAIYKWDSSTDNVDEPNFTDITVTLESSAGSLIPDENYTIALLQIEQTGDDGVFDPTVPDGTLTVDTIGDIPSGTDAATLRGQPRNSIMTDMLFRTAPPTRTPKSLAVSGLASQVLEIGSAVAINLSANFNQGQIFNGNGSTGPTLVGSVINYRFINPDTTDSVGTSSTYNIPAYEVVEGSQKWTTEVSHNEGTGNYFDSKGNASTIFDSERLASPPAASPSAQTAPITGVYPFLIANPDAPTISAGSALYDTATNDGIKLVQTKSNKTITFNFTGKTPHFAFPASYGALAEIRDQNGFDVTGSFSVVDVNITSTGLANNFTELYKIYYTASPTSINGDYQFKFTV